MECERLRRLLTTAREQGASGVEAHIEGCAPCARFARRAQAARRWFRDHHENVRPDAEFADRVMGRLERPAADLLGWAAVKLLPATLALVLLLALWSFTKPAPGELVATHPADDDLLSWVVEQDDREP